LNKGKCTFFGLLLVFTLFGLAVATPASAAAPSWISDGKYAKYHGGFDLAIGTEGQPGYIRFKLTVDSNWTLSDVVLTQAKVSGGWNISIYLFFNGSVLFSAGFGTKGTETVNLGTSAISLGEGFDFFGMEQVGAHTVLWVDSTASLTPANSTVGNRHAVTVVGSFTLPIPGATAIPITRYYDTETGMLLGFNIAFNATSFIGGFSPSPAWHGASDLIGLLGDNRVISVNQIPGLGGLEVISFPVVVSTTNVFPYAWNPGGDVMLWLYAAGVLIGISALFAILVYYKKR
jgi:hypothetical protein